VDKLGIEQETAFKKLIELPSKVKESYITIKEIKKTYKKFREVDELYHKASILSDKKDFEDFKKDKYYKGLSKEQQKDINATYKAFIKDKRKWFKAEKILFYNVYHFTKLTRSCYNKKAEADRKIEKANERYKSLGKKHCVALKEYYNTYKVFCDKKGIIRDQSTDKLLEESFILLDQNNKEKD
jgi:hypothetical protein